MISFRFHVVSITAVFLAIAIGVVVGTTYVDGAVVDGLRNRIDSVSQNLDERKAENDRLEEDLGAAGDYIDGSGAFAVTERLTDVPVLIVAVSGVDEASVAQIVILARRAGGIVPGVVWLEPSWGLQDEEDRARLAEIVDGEPDDAAATLWSAAWEGVVAELVEPAGADPEATTSTTVPGPPPDAETTTTTSPPDRAPGLLTPLVEAGFLSVDALDDASVDLADLAGTEPGVVLLTGTRARPEVEPMVPTLATAMVEGRLPLVVAHVYVDAPEAPGRGQELANGLPQGLREALILVDDADRSAGWVATVLALDAAIDGMVGLHFGYGEGADGVLPSWTPP